MKKAEYISSFRANEKLTKSINKKIIDAIMESNRTKEKLLKKELSLLSKERMKLISEYRAKFDGDLRSP